MKRGDYDVIIVGAGPAGIFCALELTRRAPDLRVLMLERGVGLDNRICPVDQGGACVNCTPCRNISGWGGAGAFSDGKLTLTTEFGGALAEYTGRAQLESLMEYCDQWYLRFGAPKKVYRAEPRMDRDLRRRAAAADLIFVPGGIRHLGTDGCVKICRAAYDELDDRVDIATGVRVREICTTDGKVSGVRTEEGPKYRSRYVVAAPGRSGSEWLAGEAERMGVNVSSGSVDIGIRVELPALVMEEITEAVYESKLLYYSKSFDDRIRTFCMCPHGEVSLENFDGLLTVNGHSYQDATGENTNFALLVSKTFTRPFNEPIRYGRNIASLANMLGGGVLVQRLGDLLAGRRSTSGRLRRGVVKPTLSEATPGDLSLVLPYRQLLGILEMLEALDTLCPGVNSRHTLLYGVEVKFYSSVLDVDGSLETRVKNLHVAGDGAGITHGLMQSSASGVHVARAILEKEDGGN